MTALPRKHPTGGQKLKKSNRVYPNYSNEERRRKLEEELRKLKKKKPLLGQQGTSSQGQPLQAQPQRGWTAQPAQQPEQQNPQQPNQQALQQNQLPPVGNLWRAMVIIIMAILAFIVVFHLISYVLPDIVPEGPTGNGNCITSCEGFAIVQAPGCDCPSDSYLSPTTPYAYNNAECKNGCKQCICR